MALSLESKAAKNSEPMAIARPKESFSTGRMDKSQADSTNNVASRSARPDAGTTAST